MGKHIHLLPFIHSLTLRILLPLVIIGVFLWILITSINWYHFTNAFNQEITKKGELIARSIENFIMVSSKESKELHHFIDSISKESGIDSIILISTAYTPPRVIASTDKELLKKNVADLDPLIKEYVTLNLQNLPTTSFHYIDNDKIVTISTTFSSWENSMGTSLNPVRTISYIEIHTSLMKGKFYFQLLYQSLIFFLAVIISFLSIVFLLNRYVFLPLKHIEHTIQERANNNNTAYAQVLHDDEIGMIANNLNKMLYSLEKSQSELKESEARFELAVQGSNDGIWDWDIKINKAYYSNRLKQLLGLTAEDSFGTTLESLTSRIHLQDQKTAHDVLMKHLHNHEPYHIEYRIKAKNEEYRWFSSSGQAIWDDQGNAIRMVGSLSDVTEQKDWEKKLLSQIKKRQKAETELENKATLLAEQEAHIHTILNTVIDGIITMDHYGIIQSINPAIERIFEYKSSEILGHPISRLIPNITLASALSEPQSTEQTGEGLKKDAIKIPIEYSISEIITAKGHTFVCTVRDISERKKAEQQLRSYLLQLARTNTALKTAQKKEEQANQAKSAFLANMSHEIRTPLNSIIGMTELLLNTVLNEKQERYTTRIYHSGEMLLNIINDILDFSKIEAGQLVLEHIPCNLLHLITEVIDILSTKASEKNLILIVDFDKNAPTHVFTDPTRLQQIFTNLIGNAIKFTPQGSVTVSVTPLNPNSKEKCTFRFTVMDTGIGIPTSKMDTIFQKFSQADVSTTRNFGGTGLGLTICKQLVEMMGGTIGVTSIEGKGSTFWFELPLELTEPDKGMENEKN